MCISTNQPDAKSYPNPNPNSTTIQHAVVSIQLNIVTCPTYREKIIATFRCHSLYINALKVNNLYISCDEHYTQYSNDIREKQTAVFNKASSSSFVARPSSTELFRSPLSDCGTPTLCCRRTSRRRRHWLFLGNG